MSLMERQSVYICLLCQDRIMRQRISLNELKAVKRATTTACNHGTEAPKKKAKENRPSGNVLRNLHKLAAFHCYVFMFEAYEKKKMSEKWKMMETMTMEKKTTKQSIPNLLSAHPRAEKTPSPIPYVSWE